MEGSEASDVFPLHLICMQFLYAEAKKPIPNPKGFFYAYRVRPEGDNNDYITTSKTEILLCSLSKPK